MTDAVPGSLHEPKRNKYFYGKLLDVAHLQMEQCYGIEKRWLLNRLALGPGVLCGLGVTAGADGTLAISPGVAIDGCGREIIVSTARASIDPAQPTDANGAPSGAKLTGGHTTIYLCYTECDAEPTMVYVSECDGVPTNAPSTTVEKYRVIVRPGLPGTEPASLTAQQADAIFPQAPAAGFDRRITTEKTLAITCPPPPDMPCVVLATVTLPSGEQPLSVDQYTYRAEVFSNTVLFELIAALAGRVDACCAALHAGADTITIASGDKQTAPVGTALANPVVLQISDSVGKPVANAAVTITTTDQGATLSAGTGNPAQTVKTTSDANGQISVRWTLGQAVGGQSFKATLATGGSVTATATASQVDTITIASGDKQTAPVGTALAKPVVLLVSDSVGKPVASAAVTITTTDRGAKLSAGTANPAQTVKTISDANGQISVRWMLGQVVGGQSFKATLATGGSVTATATASHGT
jgi:hypothetical protein